MTSPPLELSTVLVEPEIANRLTDEPMAQGARGYSLFPGRGRWARGRGSAGGVVSDWQGENVRIETVVPPRVAEAIFAHLKAHSFPSYAVFAYTSDVAVERPDRYAWGERVGVRFPSAGHPTRRCGAVEHGRAAVPERVTTPVQEHKTRAGFDRCDMTSEARLVAAAKPTAASVDDREAQG